MKLHFHKIDVSFVCGENLATAIKEMISVSKEFDGCLVRGKFNSTKLFVSTLVSDDKDFYMKQIALQDMSKEEII